jgi:hypothetical protein
LPERHGLPLFAGGYADGDPRSFEARIVAILQDERNTLFQAKMLSERGQAAILRCGGERFTEIGSI